MSRCNICDHLEGFGSSLNILGNIHNRVKFRPQVNEYLCDDCADSIASTILEGQKKEWDGTMEQTHHSLYDHSADKFKTIQYAENKEPVD
jgi:uncharacterized protein YlaI